MGGGGAFSSVSTQLRSTGNAFKHKTVIPIKLIQHAAQTLSRKLPEQPSKHTSRYELGQLFCLAAHFKPQKIRVKEKEGGESDI